MKRSAAERLVGESSLSTAERLMMMMLLRQADNDDCSVPAWRTSTMSQLAEEAARRYTATLIHGARPGTIHTPWDELERRPWRVRGEARTRATFARPASGDFPGQTA